MQTVSGKLRKKILVNVYRMIVQYEVYVAEIVSVVEKYRGGSVGWSGLSGQV